MGLENFVVAASSADDATSYFQTSLEKRKKWELPPNSNRYIIKTLMLMLSSATT